MFKGHRTVFVFALLFGSTSAHAGGGTPTWKTTDVKCSKDSDCAAAKDFNKCVEDARCRLFSKKSKKSFCMVRELVCDDGDETTTDICDPHGAECLYAPIAPLVCKNTTFECWNDFDCLKVGEVCTGLKDSATGFTAGAQCYPPSSVSCKTDEDCNLGGNACTLWTCNQNVCTAQSYISCTICTSDADCAKGVGFPWDGWTCDIISHTCLMPADDCPNNCDDNDPCTTDSCSFDGSPNGYGKNVCMHVSPCNAGFSCVVNANVTGGYECLLACNNDADCFSGTTTISCVDGYYFKTSKIGCVNGLCGTIENTQYCPFGCMNDNGLPSCLTQSSACTSDADCPQLSVVSCDSADNHYKVYENTCITSKCVQSIASWTYCPYGCDEYGYACKVPLCGLTEDYEAVSVKTGEVVYKGTAEVEDFGCCNTDADCIGSSWGSYCAQSDGAVNGYSGLCVNCSLYDANSCPSGQECIWGLVHFISAEVYDALVAEYGALKGIPHRIFYNCY